MPSANRKILILCFLISVLAFIVFAFPNAKGTKDVQMLSVFEPDEYAQYPVVQRMLSPKPTLRQTVIGFLAYDYYYYGFPFFGSSALVILPLKWLGQAENTQLTMLVLRQLVSVLPMLLAFMLLIKMWDNFQTWRSPVGLIILLTIPAVTQNALWWHPDGLVLLLTVLVLWFLYKDQFQLKHNFFLAAFFCGVLTALKLIGFHFFLAVAYCLWLALWENKKTWKEIIKAGTLFILIMALSFVIANPFLLSSWGRIAWIQIFHYQRALLDQGYGIVYQKGILSTYPILREAYGHAIFLLSILAINIWASIQSKQKHLYRLILAWSLPMTVMTFFFTHFKFQYWLPVGILLISGIIGILPLQKPLKSTKLKDILIILSASIILVQIGFFVPQNIKTLQAAFHREKTSPELAFFDHVEDKLAPISEQDLTIYFDYRLYLPRKENWQIHTSFDMLTNDYIQQNGFDVLLLLRQRIDDYLNPNVVGIDPAKLLKSQAFYQAARDGKIEGYQLLYEDETGLIFIRTELENQYNGN